MSKIIITGSNGFIGSKLCLFYLKKGFTVYAIDRPSTIPVVGSDVIFYPLDLEVQDASKLYEDIQPDFFIHCAGNANVGYSLEYPERDFQSNVSILYKTLFALKKAQVFPRLIFLSSAAVYGNPMILPIREESAIKPISPYGLNKKICEEICKYFAAQENWEIVVVRIFSAFGEGLKKQILWDMHRKIQEKGKLELFGTGEESRDFLHISDIIEAIECIRISSFPYFCYNIASGQEVTIKKLAYVFAQKYGFDPSLIQFNNIVKQGDPKNWRADISRLKELGFIPKISLEKGIERYVAFAKGQ